MQELGELIIFLLQTLAPALKWRKVEGVAVASTPAPPPRSPLVVPPITIKTSSVGPPKTFTPRTPFQRREHRPPPPPPPPVLPDRMERDVASASDSNETSSDEEPPRISAPPVAALQPQPALYCYCRCPYDEVIYFTLSFILLLHIFM